MTRKQADIGHEMEDGLKLAIAAAGNAFALSKLLGISAAALSEWRRIPSHRILQVEMVTGVPREKLRPDLYERTP